MCIDPGRNFPRFFDEASKAHCKPIRTVIDSYTAGVNDLSSLRPSIDLNSFPTDTPRSDPDGVGYDLHGARLVDLLSLSLSVFVCVCMCKREDEDDVCDRVSPLAHQLNRWGLINGRKLKDQMDRNELVPPFPVLQHRVSLGPVCCAQCAAHFLALRANYSPY
ncbi:unnamed protein product [Leuciscus chuanchicus]